MGNRFAHADDPARADRDARAADVAQGAQAIVECAGLDDRPVEFLRGVEVVVVGGQARFGQAPRLILVEHAEGHAGLHAHPAHALDHLDHRIERGPVLDLAPGRAHAEPRRSRRARGGRGLEHLILVEHPLDADLGVVFRRLRAVRAVLRAASGLHRQQRAQLHFFGLVVLLVHGLRAQHQLRQRQVVNGADLGNRPVVANHGALSSTESPR
jgi:hypothetical protein